MINQNGVMSKYTIRYVSECINGDYVLPGSKECSDSVDSAEKCAFGLKDDCIPCPRGAICPGGYEARSFPGYYTKNSQKGIVEPCEPPAIERCIGFNETTQNTLCGIGYTSVLCSRCSNNFYEAPSKKCLKCPASENNYDALLDALWPFCTVLIMCSLIMFFSIYHLEGKGMRKDESFSIAIRQTREFVIWLILSAQVMASASSSPAPNLPSWILSIYSFVSFFNFDTSYTVHESCLDEKNPYLSATVLLVGILIYHGKRLFCQCQFFFGKQLNSLSSHVCFFIFLF